jgi:predicted nucleotidyltransferase
MKNENKPETTQLFKCLVGSRAHGLHLPDSDYDYRGVFIVPTSHILELGRTTKNTHWIEGDDDNTSWELGHFLQLATKCNPTILESFLSPVEESTPLGDELRALFPYVWNSQYVRDAFIGYSHNQRKKLMDGKDERPHKYATAYLRTLHNARELLETGTFTMNVGETEFGEYLMRVKYADPDISMGEIIDRCNKLEAAVHEAYAKNPDKETDVEKVNEFLLKVRKENW